MHDFTCIVLRLILYILNDLLTKLPLLQLSINSYNCYVQDQKSEIKYGNCYNSNKQQEKNITMGNCKSWHTLKHIKCYKIYFFVLHFISQVKYQL